MENQNKKDYFLSISILIAAVLISGSLIYSVGVKEFKPETQTADIQEAVKITSPQIDDDVILGNPEAPVTIFIFSDYQCHFCGKFFKESELLIREKYVENGKAKIVHKDLAFMGPESIAAAQAAECAKEQGKYWQYHDALLEAEFEDGQVNNGNLNKNFFEKIASTLKMNVDEFMICFDSEKYSAEVEKDIKEANSVMSRVSTPTIFINDKMIQGAYPYNVFSQAIDEALSKK